MKLSKKILTFVAPIAACAAIAPIITSCNNETFSFVYGDSINCYQKLTDLPNVEVHTLNKVKEVSKNNVLIWPDDTATTTDLANYAKMPKLVYFDMVASLANMFERPFAFTWANDGQTIKYYAETDANESSNATYTYEYLKPDTGYVGVYIRVNNVTFVESSETMWNIPSFAFKGVTIE